MTDFKIDDPVVEDGPKFSGVETRLGVMDPARTVRHITCVNFDLESVARGGSTRRATCICGWHGPERGTIELAADDALMHEGSEMHVVRCETAALRAVWHQEGSYETHGARSRDLAMALGVAEGSDWVFMINRVAQLRGDPALGRPQDDAVARFLLLELD